MAGVGRIHLRVPFEKLIPVEAAAPFPGPQRLQIEARLPLHGAKLPADGIQFRFAAREARRERGRGFLRVLQLERNRLGAAARRLQLRFELRGRL